MLPQLFTDHHSFGKGPAIVHTCRQMPRTAFIFSSGRRQRLQSGPTDFLYGFAELNASSLPVEMFEEGDLGIWPVWGRLGERLSRSVAAMLGPDPRLTMQAISALKSRLSQFDVLICTTQSLGLAFSVARRLTGLPHRVFVLTMGLIEPHASALRRATIAHALHGAALAALSRPEAEWLRSVLPFAIPVHDFTFGPDLDFWSPAEPPGTGGGVVSIGSDRGRDYATLVAAWRNEFPPLTIITSLPVRADQPNVRVIQGDWRGMLIPDEDIRHRIRRARLVVVPLHDTIQPSGQSASLQAMACGRPVVLSGNRGLWDRDLLTRYDACLLVPPGDVGAMSAAVAQLLASPVTAEAMGTRARRMLEAENISTRGMAEQVRLMMQHCEA